MPDFMLILALIGVFGFVALVVGALAYAGIERAPGLRQRLQAVQAGVGAKSSESTQLGKASTSPALEKLRTFIPLSPRNMSRLQRRLARAGFTRPAHAVWFSLIQMACALVGFLVPLVIIGADGGLVPGLGAAVLGFMLPRFVLLRRITVRMRRISNGLPDALDLLIVCLEAGLGLDQAIFKTGEELRLAHPELAEELRFVNVEARAGKPRLDALKNFAARTQVDDVRALVAMLVQTDRFGTSVAQALRTYAEVSRTKRRQRAEEKAAKIGVKMVFPLVFCLFPAFFVVIIGSAVVKLVDFFSSSGPGGGL